MIKLFDLEIYNVKLKYTDINFIKAVCGNPTPPLKMEIRLAHTDVNVYQDIQNHELQSKIVACFNLPSLDVEIIFTYFSVWLWTVKINS